jgi:hypothetical protein
MTYFQGNLFSNEDKQNLLTYVGQKVGQLQVLCLTGFIEIKASDRTTKIKKLKNYLCLCECGQKIELHSNQLSKIKCGIRVPHCQGVAHRSPCKIGDIIGDLKVIDIVDKNKEIGNRPVSSFEKNGNWKIVCECLICGKKNVTKKFKEWFRYKRLIKENPNARINCGCSHPAFKKGYRSKLKPNQFEKLYKHLHGVKRRAKEKNIPYNLDIEYFIDKDTKPDGQKTGYPDYCPILKIKIDNELGADHRPSFDRVLPERGYVKGNVKIISNKANRLKSNMSIEDFKKFIEYIENNTVEPLQLTKADFIEHIAIGWGDKNGNNIDWKFFR